MRLPLISIIITTYNYAYVLDDAIRSALRQDYPNLEVLVLDNASTDATEALVATYAADKRLRYHRHPQNIGMVPNHNAGLKLAKGEYVSFLSADDFLMPGFLARSYAFLQSHPDIEVLYGGAYLVDEQARFIGIRMMQGQVLCPYEGGRNEFASLLMTGCYMCFPTMLMRRDLFTRFGLLVEDIQAADFEIVIRWAKEGIRFAYDPEPVVAVRLHPNQLSSLENNYASGRDVREQLHLARKFLTPENETKIAGFERRIAKQMSAAFAYAAKINPALAEDKELIAQGQAVVDAVNGIKTRNRALPRRTRPTIVVLAGKHITPLDETLRSLLAQTYSDFECLVVQRPGTTWAPLLRHYDPRGRIRAVFVNHNVSTGAQLNEALKIANGNAFAFMHAGTVWRQTHLEQLIEAFACDGAETILSRTVLAIDERESSMSVRSRVDLWRDLHEWPETPLLRVASTAPLDALAFRLETLDEAGEFNANLPVFDDWEMALRLRSIREFTPLDSEIEMRTTLSFPDRDIPYAAAAGVARLIHGAYPDRDDAEAALRRQLIVDLELMAAQAANPEHASRALPDFYRTAAGTRIRLRTVHA